MLSSTMRTFIGGIVPSRRFAVGAEGSLSSSEVFFFGFRVCCGGRGEDTRAGGVRAAFGACSGGGAGGVEIPGDGIAGTPFIGGGGTFALSVEWEKPSKGPIRGQHWSGQERKLS